MKICEGLTARQLVNVELFLKVDRSIDEGCNSWTQTPTSLSEAVGDLADDTVDATNDSESIRNGRMRLSYKVWEVGFEVGHSELFFSLSIDNEMFALFGFQSPTSSHGEHPRAVCDLS